MGLLTPIVGFATAVSIGTWIQLLIAIGVVALMYLATGRIITQAGYSALWILLPIAPLVFTTICFFIFWHDLNTIIFGGSIGFIGISTVGLFGTWTRSVFSQTSHSSSCSPLFVGQYPGDNTRRILTGLVNKVSLVGARARQRPAQ